jgi:hypothetical protein
MNGIARQPADPARLEALLERIRDLVAGAWDGNRAIQAIDHLLRVVEEQEDHWALMRRIDTKSGRPKPPE